MMLQMFEFLEFVEMFVKSRMKNAYLSKINILLQLLRWPHTKPSNFASVLNVEGLVFVGRYLLCAVQGIFFPMRGNLIKVIGYSFIIYLLIYNFILWPQTCLYFRHITDEPRLTWLLENSNSASRIMKL